MRRQTKLASALAVTAGLVTAPAASAADQTGRAVDGTAANDYQNVWSPSAVTVKAGETVTWDFAGTAIAHNVASNSANWSFDSGFHSGTGTESFTFAQPGTYAFVCDVHSDTMKGTVTVTDEGGNPPPPPPPPPPGQQPLPNDSQPLGGFESGDGVDRKRPTLRDLRVKGVQGGARVRFRLSERAQVEVRVKLLGITLHTKRVRAAAGRRTVTIRGYRRGRYRVIVRAVDPAGNRSRARARYVRFR
jgi:plastocyanin